MLKCVVEKWYTNILGYINKSTLKQLKIEYEMKMIIYTEILLKTYYKWLYFKQWGYGHYSY